MFFKNKNSLINFLYGKLTFNERNSLDFNFQDLIFIYNNENKNET